MNPYKEALEKIVRTQARSDLHPDILAGACIEIAQQALSQPDPHQAVIDAAVAWAEREEKALRHYQETPEEYFLLTQDDRAGFDLFKAVKAMQGEG